MKIEDIKMFHHIVESGSLVRASELLDLPKSNLSRRLKTLEQTLDIDLFHRQHKIMIVTDNGRHFYQTSKTFVEQFEAEIQTMSRDNVELSGHIRIQILALPNSHDLAKVITDFMRLHPKVTIEIISSSTEFELIKNNVDIGFRIGSQLENTDLIARKLISVDLSLYASPEYLKQQGTPYIAKDLEEHEFILFRRFNGKVDTKLRLGDHTINISGRLVLNDIELIKHACLDHQGIIFIAEHVVYDEVKKGTLIKLFTDLPPTQSHGWLLYPRRKTLSSQSQALINYILTRFQDTQTVSEFI